MRPEKEKSRPCRRATGNGRRPGRPRARAGRELAARVAQTEQARPLVEGLARRVVERRTEQPEGGVLAHVQKQRMAAAGEQAEKGRLERDRLEVERGDVPEQVVDGHQR